MPALSNAKHEVFAQGLAEGKSQGRAYVDAGYSEKNAGSNASALLAKNKQVSARVAELVAEKQRDANQIKATALAAAQYDATRVVLDLAATIQQSEDIAQRCMQIAPVLDKEGKPVLVETPSGTITPAYMFDARGANAAIANKIKALHLIGIDAGRFVHRHKHEVRTPLDQLTPGEVRLLEQALAIALEPERPGLHRLPVTIEGEPTGPERSAEPVGGGQEAGAGGPSPQDN